MLGASNLMLGGSSVMKDYGLNCGVKEFPSANNGQSSNIIAKGTSTWLSSLAIGMQGSYNE